MTVHYFITSRIDSLTSAIELAQIKRLRLFEELGVAAKILTWYRNDNQEEISAELGISGKVLNVVEYFQEAASIESEEGAHCNPPVIHEPRISIDEKNAHVKKERLKNGSYYLTYRDRWGFIDRKEFYWEQRLNNCSLYNDKGKLAVKLYYNRQNQEVLSYYYRGGANDKPILTLIRLVYQDQVFLFHQESELVAFWLDCLVDADEQAVFYSDREDYALRSFDLMQKEAPRYVVLHSVFTADGSVTGELNPYIKRLWAMEDKLSGVICATKQERADLLQRLPGLAVYAIPVTYREKSEPAECFIPKQETGKILAVARLSEVKQLDHLINAVCTLHETFPFVSLDIYGYKDGWNQYRETKRLTELVQTRQAGEYIHFAGYRRDLKEVYEAADFLVLTSRYEGFAMVILEALSHGCPVVSYDINYGPSELITQEKTGLLLPANDQQALGEALYSLYAHPEKRDEFRQNIPQDTRFTYYAKKNVQHLWQSFLVEEKLR